MFKELLPRIYYYVPPCPKCNSVITGRYIKSKNVADDTWTIKEGLKNGEIIKAVPVVGKNNCFCFECGHEWKDYVDGKILKSNEIAKEAAARHTFEFLEDILKEEGVSSKKSFGFFK